MQRPPASLRMACAVVLCSPIGSRYSCGRVFADWCLSHGGGMQVHDGIKTHVPKYRSTLHAILQIWRTEGIRTLYAGLSPNLLGSTVAWGSYFYCYNLLRGIAREHFQLDSAGQLGPLVTITPHPILSYQHFAKHPLNILPHSIMRRPRCRFATARRCQRRSVYIYMYMYIYICIYICICI
jgi:hypothetical protein